MSVDKLETCFLIVDDSRFTRLKIKGYLEKKGYSVVGEAENGIEAIKKFKELSPSHLILDLNMPHMDGMKCLQFIQKIDKNVKAVVVSSGLSNNKISELKGLGIKSFVNKPIEVDEFYKVIQDLTA